MPRWPAGLLPAGGRPRPLVAVRVSVVPWPSVHSRGLVLGQDRRPYNRVAALEGQTGGSHWGHHQISLSGSPQGPRTAGGKFHAPSPSCSWGLSRHVTPLPRGHRGSSAPAGGGIQAVGQSREAPVGRSPPRARPFRALPARAPQADGGRRSWGRQRWLWRGGRTEAADAALRAARTDAGCLRRGPGPHHRSRSRRTVRESLRKTFTALDLAMAARRRRRQHRQPRRRRNRLD